MRLLGSKQLRTRRQPFLSRPNHMLDHQEVSFLSYAVRRPHSPPNRTTGPARDAGDTDSQSTMAAYSDIRDHGAVNERADVVVIGGGVMGAAALRYLAELGCRRPLLFERETLACGSTGHCAGGVRTLFSDELNVRIGLESIRRLQRFEEELGEPLDRRS